jgi:hypothetical protein
MTTKIKSGVIAAGAIDANALSDNSITIAHLNCSDGTNGQVLSTDGSGTLSFTDMTGGVDGIVSSADTTAITIDSSENVGIGTNIPDHKFHVDVGAPNSSDKTLAAFSSQRTLRDIGFVWDDSESTLGIATLTNHDLVFHTNGNSNERMRIDSSGNVGIGSIDPLARLQIDNAVTGNGTIHLGNATYYGLIEHDATVTGSNKYTVATASLGGHIWYRGSTEQMRIDSAGDITMSGTGSLKVPSGTSAQRPSSPTAGMMRYNSSNNELEVYTNMWTPIKTEAPLSLQQPSTYFRRWTVAADGQSANTGSGYNAISVNLNFEGNFIVISKWSHDYMGIGIGYKAGITNANFTGESNDPTGPYGGDVNGDGFDSTVSFMGQYHWPISNGGANTHLTTYYIKHQRVGNTISTHYSTNSASGTDPNHASWTQVQSATISSTDHCKPVWGEASSQESLALTLLYNDISGGYNAS